MFKNEVVCDPRLRYLLDAQIQYPGKHINSSPKGNTWNYFKSFAGLNCHGTLCIKLSFRSCILFLYTRQKLISPWLKVFQALFFLKMYVPQTEAKGDRPSTAADQYIKDGKTNGKITEW